MTAPRRRDEVLRGQLSSFTRLLHRLEGGEVRAVHSTRVASRRLRELLPALQIERDRLRQIKRDLRRVTRALGRVRELDVLLGTLDDLRAESPEAGRALGTIIEEIKTARRDAHAKAFKKGLERNVRRIVRRLKKINSKAEGPRGPNRPDGNDDNDRSEPNEGHDSSVRKAGHADSHARWLRALDIRVARRAIALRRAIVHAGGVFLADRLHDVRKATKKLRYSVELAAQASAQPQSLTLRTLKRTQDVLGQLHDQQVAIDRIRELQASPDGPDVEESVGALNAALTGLENESRRLHARYVRGRDDLLAICDQLSTRIPAAVLRAQRATRLAHAG